MSLKLIIVMIILINYSDYIEINYSDDNVKAIVLFSQYNQNTYVHQLSYVLVNDCRVRFRYHSRCPLQWHYWLVRGRWGGRLLRDGSEHKDFQV